MNNAIPIAIGTPMIIAMNDDISVPNSSAAIPNSGGVRLRVPLLGGEQVHGLCAVNAGIAFQIRKTAIAAMITRSKPPDPAASPLKTRSPIRSERPATPASRRPSGGLDPGGSIRSALSGWLDPIGNAPGTPLAATSN